MATRSCTVKVWNGASTRSPARIARLRARFTYQNGATSSSSKADLDMAPGEVEYLESEDAYVASVRVFATFRPRPGASVVTVDETRDARPGTLGLKTAEFRLSPSS